MCMNPQEKWEFYYSNACPDRKNITFSCRNVKVNKSTSEVAIKMEGERVFNKKEKTNGVFGLSIWSRNLVRWRNFINGFGDSFVW